MHILTNKLCESKPEFLSFLVYLSSLCLSSCLSSCLSLILNLTFSHSLSFTLILSLPPHLRLQPQPLPLPSLLALILPAPLLPLPPPLNSLPLSLSLIVMRRSVGVPERRPSCTILISTQKYEGGGEEKGADTQDDITYA